MNDKMVGVGERGREGATRWKGKTRAISSVDATSRQVLLWSRHVEDVGAFSRSPGAAAPWQPLGVVRWPAVVERRPVSGFTIAMSKSR